MLEKCENLEFGTINLPKEFDEFWKILILKIYYFR